MAYTLSVAPKVRVPMKFKMQDGAALKHFDFKLECDRLTIDDFQARNKNDDGVTTNEKIKETMLEITSNWQGQTLVLDDEKQPAPFCREALEVMFQTPGVLDVAVTAYMTESAAKTKN